MTARRWPATKRKQALDLAEQIGPHAAAAQLGIPEGTVRTWTSRERTKERAQRRAESEPVAVEIVDVTPPARPTEWSELAKTLGDEQGQVAAQALDEVRAALRAGDTRRAQAAALTHAILVDKANQHAEAEAVRKASQPAQTGALDRDIDAMFRKLHTSAGRRMVEAGAEKLLEQADEFEQAVEWLRKEARRRAADEPSQLEGMTSDDLAAALGRSAHDYWALVLGHEAVVAQAEVVANASTDAQRRLALEAAREDARKLKSVREEPEAAPVLDVASRRVRRAEKVDEPSRRGGPRRLSVSADAVPDLPSRAEADAALRRAGYGPPPSGGSLL